MLVITCATFKYYLYYSVSQTDILDSSETSSNVKTASIELFSSMFARSGLWIL